MFHSQSGDVCRVEYDCQVLIPGFGFEAVRRGRFPASNHVAVYFISGGAVFRTRASNQLSSTLTVTRFHTLSNTLSNAFEHVFQTRTFMRFKFNRISFRCRFITMPSCFNGVALNRRLCVPNSPSRHYPAAVSGVQMARLTTTRRLVVPVFSPGISSLAVGDFFFLRILSLKCCSMCSLDAGELTLAMTRRSSAS